MNPTQIALHRTRCTDDACMWHQNAAESRKEAAEEPLDVGEESGRADQYERGIGYV